MPERSLLNITVYTIAAYVVAKTTWNNIPGWVKNSITGQPPSDHEKDANDDLANPTMVWRKINEVMSLAQKLTEDPEDREMAFFRIQAAFVSMIHLMTEIDLAEPDFREHYFSQGGEDVTEAELETLLNYLDYAQWAYKESQIEVERLLRPRNYKLIRFDNATEPGRVGHYIAVDHGKKQIIIAIKGTSTVSDVFTDLISKAIPHSVHGHQEIRCHEGMYIAAKMMLDDTLHLIQNFFLPQNYKLIICGHSLGAGVSSLLGIFLKQEMPNLEMQVYAFATPACASYEASENCQEYITAVVNNNDCVPRLSLMNVRMMKKLLMLMDSKLEEKGLSPKSFAAARALLKDLMVTDTDLLMTTKELTDFLNTEMNVPRTERFVEMELYVPGRVVTVWNHTNDANIIGGKVTTGQSQVLRQIFVEANMISDHSCDNYRINLQHLLEQTANTI